MGKVAKAVARVGLGIFTAGTSELLFAAKDAMDPDMPDVMSAEQIEAEAKEKSSEQARRFSKARKTAGKTIYTSPSGVGGMQNLKTKYGN
jgi:hypothetical protein